MSDRTDLETQKRERAAAASGLRFEKATTALANEHRFGGPEVASTEVEILDEALRLVDESRSRR
jgi:hypothetical protein